MNTPVLRLFFALVPVLPVLVHAQSVPPPAAAKPAETQAVVLSPFVVTSENDEGYRATFTSAGSRLRTDLKDIAASVTVLTDEFMNDLGANDVASALAFVSGAENDSTYHQENLTFSGANNYIGGDFGDNNNRSGEVRVRGLGRATTTINFIEVLGSTDRYNTDRSEFLRGANSILFGLSEPAGLINSSTKTARTNRNSTRVETKVDDRGSNRLVLDHNQVLIKNRLALRAVGLYNDQSYAVDTAYQRDKRLFIPGAEGREYARALALETKEAPSPYDKSPAPVLVIRQRGEAWTRPFAVVYEPTAAAAGTIQAVTALTQRGEFAGFKIVQQTAGRARTDYVLVLPTATSTYEDAALGLSFTGRYAVVSLDDRDACRSLYLGEGTRLRLRDRELVAPPAATSAFRAFSP